MGCKHGNTLCPESAVCVLHKDPISRAQAVELVELSRNAERKAAGIRTKTLGIGMYRCE